MTRRCKHSKENWFFIPPKLYTQLFSGVPNKSPLTFGFREVSEEPRAYRAFNQYAAKKIIAIVLVVGGLVSVYIEN